MSIFQKIAALVFRLVSLGMIIYSCVGAASAIVVGMTVAVWLLLPTLVGGVILYFAAIPLAWLATRGFDE